MENDKNKIEEDINSNIKKLKEIPEYIKNNLTSQDKVIFELKSAEAIYLSTQIEADLTQNLANVMKEVQKIVKKTDNRTRGVYILSVLLLIISIGALWYTVHIASKDEGYKNELIELTGAISESAKDLDSLVANINSRLNTRESKIYPLADSLISKLNNINNSLKK